MALKHKTEGKLIPYKMFLEQALGNPKYTEKQIYHIYLHTDRWHELHDARMKLDNHRCRMCDAPATCVHHRRYPKVYGEETIDDLTSLCTPCHHNYHKPPSIKDLAIQIKELRKKPGGTTCSCCEQHVQEYKRKINSGMATTLIEIYRVSKKRNFEGGWFNVFQTMAENAFHTSHDWGGLKQWGILEQKAKDANEKKKRDSGMWRITEKGNQFVLGEIMVPKYVVLFNKELIRLEGDLVSIQECLGYEFDYEELRMGDSTPPK